MPRNALVHGAEKFSEPSGRALPMAYAEGSPADITYLAAQVSQLGSMVGQLLDRSGPGGKVLGQAERASYAMRMVQRLVKTESFDAVVATLEAFTAAEFCEVRAK